MKNILVHENGEIWEEKNVLVWGTGQAWEKIKKIIKEDKFKILAFIDTYVKDEEQFKDGKKIICPNKISNYNYDLILIASSATKEITYELKKFNIDEEKVIDLYEFSIRIEEIYYNKLYLSQQFKKLEDEKIDTIVTGLSYARWGINEKLAKPNLVNLAMDSSDLYSNYLIAKKAMQISRNVKNIIIGLSYYSFEYDLSKIHAYSKYHCKIAFRDLIDDNRNVRNDMIKDFDNFKSLYNKNLAVSDGIDLDPIGKVSLLDYSLEDRIKKCKEQAIIESHKNYPNTVKMNIEIMKNYLQMLKDNNCKIQVIVFPVSNIYSKYFDKRLKNEFYTIIKNLRIIYDFKLLDYFECDEMNDGDFRDGSHLNANGRNKFTNILNSIIG